MWPLTFITEKDFTEHVKATIEKYGEKLELLVLKNSIAISLTLLNLYLTRWSISIHGRKLLKTKFSVKEINQTTMILDIFIRECSNISKIAKCLKLAGM